MARTEADCFHGFQSGEPGKHIDIVYMLFHYMVAREPFPVHPVTYHEFEIVPLGLTVAIPQHALIPIDCSTGDLTDKTIHHLLVALHIFTFVVTLCAGHYGQFLCLCLFSCSNQGTVTGCIHANRFFQETVFTFFYRIFEMFRTEEGRCAVDQHVDTAVDHLFVCI
ncbi:hypothetical protein SDC9_207305 [bioreactor metagenome]|uniref:Uncharacterized protein n=1 Tax=bioreactor metagenome TaxID=1076179 RepID=A0A645JGV5_9ZZZZ